MLDFLLVLPIFYSIFEMLRELMLGELMLGELMLGEIMQGINARGSPTKFDTTSLFKFGLTLPPSLNTSSVPPVFTI